MGHRERDTQAEMLRDTALGRGEGAWEAKGVAHGPSSESPFQPGEKTRGAEVEPKVRTRSEGPKGQEGPVRSPRKGSEEEEEGRDGPESWEPGKDVCRRGLGSRPQGRGADAPGELFLEPRVRSASSRCLETG